MKYTVILALAAVAIATPTFAKDGEGKALAVLQTAPAVSGPSGLVSVDPPSLRYATVYADVGGTTHVQRCTLDGFVFKSYAPPAAPQWLGIPPGDIKSISYNVLPVDYVGAWHHAPGRQWVVVLSGRWSVETTDGTVLEQGPGEVQFNAGHGARPRGADGNVGHLTRQVGSQPNVQLII